MNKYISSSCPSTKFRVTGNIQFDLISSHIESNSLRAVLTFYQNVNQGFNGLKIICNTDKKPNFMDKFSNFRRKSRLSNSKSQNIIFSPILINFIDSKWYYYYQLWNKNWLNIIVVLLHNGKSSTRYTTRN